MLFDVRLTPTAEELYDGLRRAQLRHAGKGRLTVQTVLLVMVAIWALVAFFAGGMTQIGSLLIGLVSLILIPVMWFVPELQMKAMANSMAESDNTAHMWVFEDGLDFGEEVPEHAYFDFRSVYADVPTEDYALQTLVLRFASDDVIVVPRRQLSDEQWQILIQKTKQSNASKRRHI